MLQAGPHAVHFKRILDFGEEQVLLLLKNQEVVIREKLEILDKLEPGLLRFADDLRARHHLLWFVRGVRAVRGIVDDGHAAMGF